MLLVQAWLIVWFDSAPCCAAELQFSEQSKDYSNYGSNVRKKELSKSSRASSGFVRITTLLHELNNLKSISNSSLGKRQTCTYDWLRRVFVFFFRFLVLWLFVAIYRAVKSCEKINTKARGTHKNDVKNARFRAGHGNITHGSVEVPAHRQRGRKNMWL